MALWRVSQKILLLGIVLLCLVYSVLPDVSARECLHNEDLGNLDTGRHLLQTLTQCPIDFATKNYSSITNVCHESNPDKVLCCSAFVNFTCQYVTYFDDQTTNCATTLFSYLSLAGNYSAELFSSLCQGSQQGLQCPIVPAPSPLPSSAFFCMFCCGYEIIIMKLQGLGILSFGCGVAMGLLVALSGSGKLS